MHEARDRSESLFAQLTWTRRLAAELVTDAALAEDLVQDAWVQYLTRPPRSTGSLNAWFAKVMHNLARQRWRRDRRWEDLRRARDEASEATVELVAQAQAQRALVEAVLDLEQPYRDVVLLRFFEDLESPAIAAKLDMRASSVRTRLQRGLALLRQRLEARHGPEARQWLAAIVPLLERPSGVKLTAAPLATGAAGAAASFPGSWLLATALVIAALTAILFVVRSPSGRVDLAPAGEQVADLAADALLELDATEGAGERTAKSIEDEQPDSSLTPIESRAGAGALEAAPPRESETVVYVRVDGVSAKRGTVYLSLTGRWISPDAAPAADEVLRLPVAPGGLAVFDGVAPMRGAVGLEPSPGAAVVQRTFAREDAGEPIVFETGTASIDGRLWDTQGNPARGIEVLLGMNIGRDYGAIRAKCATDTQGRFGFEGLPAAGFWLHTRAPGLLGEMRSHGALAVGEVRQVQMGRPSGLVRWSGRLVDLEGAPIDPLDPHSEQRLEFARLDGVERSYFPAELGPYGRFSVELVPGEYSIRRMIRGNSTSQLVESRVSVQADEQRDLVLRGARVHGTVQLAGRGTPFDPSLDGRVVLRLVQVDEEGRTTRYETTIGTQGRFAFEGVQPGSWTLEGDRVAETAPIPVMLAAGDRERRVDVLVR